MNDLDNNNNLEADLMPARKAKVSKEFEVADGAGVSIATINLTPLETSIQSRRNNLNFPALQSMFELTEGELQSILDKLGPLEDCNC
jgi:hypothetical protein